MTFKSKARRAGWLLVVAAFAFGIVSAVKPAQTSAYGLITSRSIKMSSSEIGTTGGNTTIYSVGFTPVSGQTIGSMVVRFCALNPIIGDTCDPPLGFNSNHTTLTIQNQTGITNWTLQTGVSDNNELLFTRPSAAAYTSAVTFDLGNGSTTGITNPQTPNQSFYARIMLFGSTSSAAMPSLANDLAISTDAGGVALSTTNVLNVTAKVQETLVFCVYTQANCAGGGNAVALGDSNGVLAATNQVYLNATPKFDLASNALGGVMVRLKGDTLTSGAFTISANGPTCAADSTTSSVEQFGVRVVTYGANQTFPGTTGDADDFSCNAGFHKFSPAAANTTYGQTFVKTLGATDVSTTSFEIAAKAAGTTEAGVYTSKLQLIATATY